MTNKVLDIFSPFNTKDIFEDFDKELMNMTSLFNPFGALTARDNLLSRYEKTLQRSGTLAIDLKEEDGKYKITADVPGFTEDEIDVHIENNVLSISAEKSNLDKDSSKDDKNIIQERSYYQRIERKINLGSRSLKTEDITASLENGTLEISIPLSEESLPKRISIGINERKEIEEEKKEG